MSVRNVVAAVAAVSIAASAAAPAFANDKGDWWWWHHHHHHFHHFGAHAGGINAWPAFLIIGAVASVELDAAIVWHTQCRELTSQEAFTSFFLPVVGIALDEKDNKCKH
jgi:hypothetical protein